MPDGTSALKERAADLLDDGEIKEQAEKLYDMIAKGFDDQRERTDRIMDYWELFNCQLGRYQNYSGNSKIFLPIIRNAVNALVVRYVNQSFPTSGRHVEAVTGEDDQPFALLSLIEHYIAESDLRTQAATELLTNGQIEGQYNAYFHWSKRSRVVVTREDEPIKVDGVSTPELGKLTVTIEEEIEDSCPMIEVLHDADVLVLPATASSIEEALEVGGAVVVMRRWTKSQVEKMIDDEEIDEDTGQEIIDAIGQAEQETKVPDTEKKLAFNAGINISRGKVFAQIFEAWHKFEVDGERRLCRAFFTAEKKCAGVKRNPYWNDRCPLRSAPVKKLPGVFKGESPVASSQDMQILANDMINEASDMMYYVLAPVIAADPQQVNKWKELVADIGAVWPVKPDAIKLIEYPNRVREALEVIGVCKGGIFENLQVNPAMLPQQTGKPGAKRNQAEIAMELQVDILQTADAVTIFEQEILTPFVQWAAELDHQFREKEILVREYGDMGLKADMENIKPIQWGKRWMIRWVGVETQRTMANIQQVISFINVVKELPVEMLNGRRVDIVPAVDYAMGVICGPTLARKVWINAWEEQSVSAEVENEMLAQGFEVMTHAGDDDAKHIQEHLKIPPGPMRDHHINAHKTALMLKQKAMIMQQMQQMGIFPPAAAKPGARQARGARSGAQARPPRQAGQQPPGMIRPDNMARAGTAIMPRKPA